MTSSELNGPLVSLILCRYSPTSADRLTTICEFSVNDCFENAPSCSSQLSFEYAPPLNEILMLVQRDADFGCTNVSRTELYQYTIHCFILLNNNRNDYSSEQLPLTNMVLICVSKSSAVDLDVASFLRNVQRLLASDREAIKGAIVSADGTGNSDQSVPKIQQKLRHLMMMANEKFNHQTANYNNGGAGGGVTVLSVDSGFSSMSATTPQQPSTAKITDLRRQVEEVKTVMSDNMIRILERGERLENLDHRTEALHASSQNFKTTARRVQRNMCLKNLKWTIVLIVFISMLSVVILYTVLNELGVFSGNH